MRLVWKISYLLAVTLPCAAQSTTISTISGWSGSGISPFGLPNTQTYGQTVTVPSGFGVLESFAFEMMLPTSLVFRGEVYAWNGQEATGPALWESAPMTTTTSGFQLITFNTGGITLTPGNVYVLFATTSKDNAGNPGFPQGEWGFTTGYSGGSFVYNNNGTSTAQWFSPVWPYSALRPRRFRQPFMWARQRPRRFFLLLRILRYLDPKLP